ncbi:hypothetical protein BH10ACI1_BH10ACI1_20130 [soil metagenome]
MDDENELVKLSNDWMRAWQEDNRIILEEILADDFTLTSALSTGELVSRQMWLDLAGTQIKGKYFNFDEIKVRVYGNAAVVNSIFIQEATAFGKDWSGKFLLTDVWIKKNDRWQVVARHSSRPVSK